MNSRISLLIIGLSAILFASGCSSEGTTAGVTPNLEAECVDDASEVEGWLCPEPQTLECEDGVADPDLIFFEPKPTDDSRETCADFDYELNDEGPFEVGEHDILITEVLEEGEEGPAEVLCETTLTVQDKQDPEANDEPVELWPPNHKWHTISGEDCVWDACDTDLQVTFNSATSDEPVNDKGDGNTEPDIILECDRVQVRSERQGGSNGRVYKLGWTAVDDSGNHTDGECTVVVPHDQSGRDAIDDGPAYEITLADDECDDGTGGAGGEGGSGGAGGEGGAGGQAGAGGTGGAGGEGGAGGTGGIVVP